MSSFLPSRWFIALLLSVPILVLGNIATSAVMSAVAQANPGMMLTVVLFVMIPMVFSYTIGLLVERRKQALNRMQMAHELADLKKVGTDSLGQGEQSLYGALTVITSCLQGHENAMYPTAERPKRRERLDGVYANVREAAKRHFVADEEGKAAIGAATLVAPGRWKVPIISCALSPSRIRYVEIRLEDVCREDGKLVSEIDKPVHQLPIAAMP